MGKQNTQKKIRDSSLKHPLSKECVCFMCFPFFSFFFPMFFVFLPNYFFGFSNVFFVCPRVFWFIFVPVFSCLLHRSVYRICRDHGFFEARSATKRIKQYCIFFKESCIKACRTVLKECNGFFKWNCFLKNTFSK